MVPAHASLELVEIAAVVVLTLSLMKRNSKTIAILLPVTFSPRFTRKHSKTVSS